MSHPGQLSRPAPPPPGAGPPAASLQRQSSQGRPWCELLDGISVRQAPHTVSHPGDTFDSWLWPSLQ